MITTGAELETFVTSLNAEAQIDATLLDVLVDNARAILEEERPWMVLRRTDTSLSVSAGENQTIDISTITDFSKLHSRAPIKVYDGNYRIAYYKKVPFEERLEYKNVSNTFCHDEYNNIIYFNGKVQFAGTVYINYIATTGAIDLTSESSVWTPFPSRFLPILGYYAIGIFKGAVDYDSINRQMLPENRETLKALKDAMTKWDDDKQQSDIEHNDPTDMYGGHRDGAINRN